MEKLGMINEEGNTTRSLTRQCCPVIQATASQSPLRAVSVHHSATFLVGSSTWVCKVTLFRVHYCRVVWGLQEHPLFWTKILGMCTDPKLDFMLHSISSKTASPLQTRFTTSSRTRLQMVENTNVRRNGKLKRRCSKAQAYNLVRRPVRKQ